MEQAKLSQEAAQLGQDISGLQSLLASREEVLALVLQEAQQVADRHGGDRRSLLVQVGRAGLQLCTCCSSHCGSTPMTVDAELGAVPTRTKTAAASCHHLGI
jgi:DNA gyrase/topoisomerase IV subunit A